MKSRFEHQLIQHDINHCGADQHDASSSSSSSSSSARTSTGTRSESTATAKIGHSPSVVSNPEAQVPPPVAMRSTMQGSIPVPVPAILLVQKTGEPSLVISNTTCSKVDLKEQEQEMEDEADKKQQHQEKEPKKEIEKQQQQKQVQHQKQQQPQQQKQVQVQVQQNQHQQPQVQQQLQQVIRQQPAQLRFASNVRIPCPWASPRAAVVADRPTSSNINSNHISMLNNKIKNASNANVNKIFPPPTSKAEQQGQQLKQQHWQQQQQQLQQFHRQQQQKQNQQQPTPQSQQPHQLMQQKQQHQQQLQLVASVDNLNPTDIVSGRGAGVNLQPGSVLYRNILRKYKSSYSKTGRTAEKRFIINSIISEAQAKGSRFLKPAIFNIDGRITTRKWLFLTPPEIYKKTSQALRDMKDREKDEVKKDDGGGGGGKDGKKKEVTSTSNSAVQIPPKLMDTKVTAEELAIVMGKDVRKERENRTDPIVHAQNKNSFMYKKITAEELATIMKQDEQKDEEEKRQKKHEEEKNVMHGRKVVRNEEDTNKMTDQMRSVSTSSQEQNDDLHSQIVEEEGANFIHHRPEVSTSTNTASSSSTTHIDTERINSMRRQMEYNQKQINELKRKQNMLEEKQQKLMQSFFIEVGGDAALNASSPSMNSSHDPSHDDGHCPFNTMTDSESDPTANNVDKVKVLSFRKKRKRKYLQCQGHSKRSKK